MPSRTQISFLALLACAPFSTGRAQDSREQEARTDHSPLGKLRAHLDESVQWYQFAPAEGEEPLKPRIVLRWDNLARGTGSAVGLTVVWADDTRPHAIAAVFPWAGRVTHECDLLAREAKLVVQRDGRLVWGPKEAGVEFRPVPESPPPAADKSRRRLQLKQIAAQFEATMMGWNADNSDKQELRMLPQWLYRYGREGAECLDGAMFAFVMGTDPEAVLLLEAFRTGEDEYQWQFAFARRTSGALEGRWKEDVVWTAEKFPVGNDPAQPHITFSEALPLELRQVD